ncbi:MAG: tRNA preQ1(34) S-adenosylmethionine ribosyltransferase-isomerase QueA [Deltaproteobacteria bacterium]|nr:tRNA preQ1(34) S-adenosylmethionine ribosyltransferase-isomerase QueA [Deltaproteobacteria bacterium]
MNGAAKAIKGLEDFFFDLPRELIAQEPPRKRGDSRLMVLSRDTGDIEITHFSALEGHLPQGALLVFNDAKVTPARLYGHKKGRSGRLEVLILNPPAESGREGVYELWCLGSPGKRLRTGAELVFEGEEGTELEARVLDINAAGHRLLRFLFSAPPSEILDRVGRLPLPPYIKRPDAREDLVRYQTVYARRAGAVAAPTAGLHFTQDHLRRLREAGHELAGVHLRVGAGTFLPLSERNLERGRLHEEYVEVGLETARKVNDARSHGVPVVSVGTTSLRALEWASLSGEVEPKSGLTDIFIRPGFSFRAADALVTNFHLPGSSLIMLAAAFAGLQNLKRAYETAVREGFRFFSYGDAMLIV